MKSKQYTLEPPEGGWGYLICVGLAITFITGGITPCFGLIFKDFFEEIGGGTTAYSIVTGSIYFFMSFGALFSSSLFQKFGVRRVGLVASLVYLIGSLAQVFAQSALHLFIAYGLFQGLPFGIFMTVTYSTFNQYFVKNRIMMMSLGKTMTGLGMMIYPILVQRLLDWYGFRGTLLIIAAFNGHAVFGMLIMHPVEWHMKKVEVDTELQEVKEKQDHHDDRKDEEEFHQMMQGPRKSIGQLKDYRRLSVEPLSISRRASRVASSVVTEKYNDKKTGKWMAIVNFLDLTLFKNFIFVNIVLGATFAWYSDVTFFAIQPLYLYELGYSRADTALIMAIGSACDLASRIVLGFTALFCTAPARFVYLSGVLLTFISRFVFLQVTDFTAMAVITGILGFLKTWFHVTLPLTFAEHLPAERFAAGYGLFMFVQGNLTFAISPVAGYIRDLTGDYGITFHFINAFMGVCALTWIIEIGFNRFSKKNRQDETC